VPVIARRSSKARVFVYILILLLLASIIVIGFYTYKHGGLDYVREKIENLSYRLRSSYEPHGRSNIPYVQTNNKPEDAYTDPFS
jgi:hypothetical protein